MEKLTSMVDFVLEKRKIGKGTVADVLNSVFKYADVLKQPLKLGMFVPCDEDGNVLEEPTPEDILYDDNIYEQYQQAKERVLFEGNLTVKKHGENNVVYLNDSSFYTSWNKSKTIEDLIPYNLTLIEK
jgi:hypothetical protein